MFSGGLKHPGTKARKADGHSVVGKDGHWICWFILPKMLIVYDSISSNTFYKGISKI